MATYSGVERMTPLDLLMPKVYITSLLTFRTSKHINELLPILQKGLDSVVKELPWLSGRVFPTKAGPGTTPSLKIRWDLDHAAAPRVVDKGYIEASYEQLSQNSMQQEFIPANVWPDRDISEDEFAASGAPVLMATVFRFADNKAIGLCPAVHHNAVDGTGFAEIVRMLAKRISEPGSATTSSGMGRNRSDKLAQALSAQLEEASSCSLDGLFARHPEFSRSPPTFPSEFPSCTSKLLTIPMARLEKYRELVRSHVTEEPTTNTLVCALVWSAVTRARMQRDSSLENSTVKLPMAVNGRHRIGDSFSSREDPYFGNTVLYSFAELSTNDSVIPGEPSGEALGKICKLISESQSASRINGRYIAEVCTLVNRMDDYKAIFPGFDFFSSRDMFISSWAGLDMYDWDFGSDLGHPEFVRHPYSEADGVILILPKRRVASGGSDWVIDVTVNLRRDDLAVLEQDTLWQNP